MDGWITMPICREIGFDPSNVVLDGDPATPKKWEDLPNFRPIFIVAKRLDGERCSLVRRKASAQATLC